MLLGSSFHILITPTDTDTDPMADQYQEVAFVAASESHTLRQYSATLAEQSGIVFQTNGAIRPKAQSENGGLTAHVCEGNNGVIHVTFLRTMG